MANDVKPNQIVIQCELIITPGGQSRQSRLRLSVLGETVFDEYERDLDAGRLQVLSQIVAAHGRLLTKYASALMES